MDSKSCLQFRTIKIRHRFYSYEKRYKLPEQNTNILIKPPLSPFIPLLNETNISLLNLDANEKGPVKTIKPFVLGLCGMAYSGKNVISSYLRDELIKKGYRVCILNEKDFLVVSMKGSKNQSVKANQAVDWSGLIKKFKEVCETDSSSNSPDVIIFRGRYFLGQKDIKSYFNLKIFLDTETDLILSRRIFKGINNGYCLEKMIDHYMRKIKPDWESRIEPLKPRADFCFVNFAKNSLCLQKKEICDNGIKNIVGFLALKLSKRGEKIDKNQEIMSLIDLLTKNING